MHAHCRNADPWSARATPATPSKARGDARFQKDTSFWPKLKTPKAFLYLARALVIHFSVTVHGAPVILSAAKNLSWNRGPDEILRYAQNDDVFPARERLPFFLRENMYQFKPHTV